MGVPEPSRSLPAVHEAWLPREHALHRPRHGGRQLTALISALVFFVTPALLWVFGGRPAEIENHELAAFPSVTDGWGLFTGIPAWATDQLVFRADAIHLTDAISRGVFAEPAPLGQGESHNPLPLPGTPQQDPVPGDRQAQPGEPDGGSSRRVIEGSDGWLYYGFDAEAKCSPTQPISETVAELDELRTAVQKSGREFVFVVAPDKSTMVPQHLPKDYVGKDCAETAAEEFWRQTTGPGQAIDLRPHLIQAQQAVGHPIYPPNDTHWADEGSIILTRQLAEALRPGITGTWRSRVVRTYTVGADLPRMLGRQETKTNTAYDLRPNGFIDRTKEHVSDIDAPVRRVSGPIDETINRRTLLVGDSFASTSSRYLLAGFSDLTFLGYPDLGSDVQTSITEFVDAEVVIVQAVERAVASGNLPFLDEEFIERAGAAMAARPIR